MTKVTTNLQKIWRSFSPTDLIATCERHELDFQSTYDLERVNIPDAASASMPEPFYLFGDHGSKILAVAHLDTVGPHYQRGTQIIDTAGGTVVYSRALDDRLGAHIILDLLPSLGMQFDVLLTIGEETGESTAQHFDPAFHHDRDYNWIIEFDRGGTDVVLYQYHDTDTAALVRQSGAFVEQGIFSDISYMSHVGVKGFNWGVGYQDYHGPRAHAWLDDTFEMLDYFMRFHDANKDTVLPHDPDDEMGWWGSYRKSSPSKYGWTGGYHGHGFDDLDDLNPDDGEADLVIELDKEACDGFQYGDSEACGGPVHDTQYGPLCDEHFSIYAM